MNSELANVHHVGRAMLVADTIQVESEQRRLLGEYVSKQMTEGTDYGVIPGTKNKTLLKPGAEKLTALFRCSPKFTIEEKVENWETGLFFYRFSCQILTLSDGAVVAEGVGSCSTYESRYRWRKSDRLCPACGKDAIKRSKYPPRNSPQAQPGWYCYDKAGGCGATYDAEDDSITSQPIGRVENPDLCDSANTVLKMAKKRALVDSAIALARCSDLFTQDAEDFHPQEESAPVRQPAKPKILPGWAEVSAATTEEQYKEAWKLTKWADETERLATVEHFRVNKARIVAEGEKSSDPTATSSTSSTSQVNSTPSTTTGQASTNSTRHRSSKKPPTDQDVIDLCGLVAKHEGCPEVKVIGDVCLAYNAGDIGQLNPVQIADAVANLSARLKAKAVTA